MTSRLVGKVVCWKKELISRAGLTFIRSNQGIHLGDVGLVVSQSVTELEVLMKDQLVFFHTIEVEVVS